MSAECTLLSQQSGQDSEETFHKEVEHREYYVPDQQSARDYAQAAAGDGQNFFRLNALLS